LAGLWSSGRVVVRAPATSANLGPGFDAVGISLSLYNRAEAVVAGDGLEITIEGEGEDSIPRDESNLVWQAICRFYAEVGRPLPPGVRLGLRNGIPPSSGLGSSAAAIACGLLMAAGLTGVELPPQSLIRLAADLDGHPDNVAPALLGGMVVVVPDGRDGYRWLRLLPRSDLRVAVALPDMAVSTKHARQVLPGQVAFGDAAFNAGRAALLVGALAEGRLDLLSAAMEDRLHQAHRLPLVPGAAAALEAALREGWGVCLSGSGPSVVALGSGPDPRDRMALAFAAAGVSCRVLDLNVDCGGARLIEASEERGRPAADWSGGGRWPPPRARVTPGPLLVHKYGGTSVSTPDKLKQVARRIASCRGNGRGLVVVVSAMGDGTDALLSLAGAVSGLPNGRELDRLLATGEQASVALLAMALGELGIDAVSVCGANLGIITDGVFLRARVERVQTGPIQACLDRGQVVIAAGYQGISAAGELTTLGRGGSDTSAVALAAALGAPICEIYTDVDGVYTADPRVVPSARLLRRIGYDEMAEMAGLGAGVMQPRAVELARRHGVRIVVRHCELAGDGTLISDDEDTEAETMEATIVRSVAHSLGEVRIVLESVPDRPGVAARVFRAMAADNISVDMIIQGQSHGDRNDIAFTVSRDDSAAALAACTSIGAEVGARRVAAEDVVKVSVIGAGVTGDMRVLAAIFDCLAEAGINIEMISTSGTRVSCLIRPELAAEAVQRLHQRLIESPAWRAG